MPVFMQSSFLCYLGYDWHANQVYHDICRLDGWLHQPHGELKAKLLIR